jgi:hypothetical protein
MHSASDTDNHMEAIQRHADDLGVHLSVNGDITIRDNQATNSDILACKSATQLRGSLTIMVTPSEATIRCLCQLVEITGTVRIMIHAGMEPLPRSFLAHLERIRKDVIIADCLYLTDVNCFSSLRSVRSIHAIDCHRLGGLSEFSSLEDIHVTISINGCRGIVDLGGFPAVKGLHALGVYNCPRLTHVTGFPRLSPERGHFRFRAVNCPGLMSTSGISRESGDLFTCIGRLHLSAMTDRFRSIHGGSDATIATSVARNAARAASAARAADIAMSTSTDIRPAPPEARSRRAMRGC